MELQFMHVYEQCHYHIEQDEVKRHDNLPLKHNQYKKGMTQLQRREKMKLKCLLFQNQ